MSTAADILREENAMGSWPRRLLHVDTLTSYEWQPGNRYGPATEPRYAAITYTWGRWKLDGNERNEVSAIPVRGVPWDIPRVNPLRFTVQELEAVVTQARTAPPSMATTAGVPQCVDFVWLDVACIDQRENNARAASEMGRQANIFRGASFVYAWLSAISIQQLNQIFGARQAFESGRDPDAAFGALSTLTSDPWFSSLWTLQEAFLRTDAVFFSRDAQMALAPQVSRNPSGEFHPTCFTLRAVIYFVNALKMSEESGMATTRPWSDPARQAYDQAVALGVKTGLYALSLRNAVGTFILAQHRKAERKEDRVYGIQQIFSFRLGKTAPGWTGRIYSLEELEDEFAKQLLVTYPVQSQMHVFTKAAKFSTAWRLNESSVFPKMNEPYFPWIGVRKMVDEDRRQVVTATCELWVEETDGILWGWFRGKVCDFDFWMKRCKEADDDLIGQYGQLPTLTAFLDVTDELNNCPEYGAPASDIYSQRRLIERLHSEFPSGGLKVLELGMRDFPPDDYDSDFDSGGPLTHGLLLVPKQAPNFQYYHRVGFCTWYRGSFSSQKQSELASESKELSGRFG